MKFSIKVFLSLFLVYGTVAIAADTASILPPAETTFFDQNGNPLTSGKIDFYIPGTTNRKTTWQDAAETIPNTNPVILDAAGRALILGSGSYRQVVKDKNNNLMWDQVTSSVGSGGGGSTTVGDGNNVGAIIHWPGLIAPSGYVFTYGQEIDRVTYVSLMTAITQSQNVTCVSGSPILNTVADTTQLNIGAAVEGSCIAASSVIVSKTSTTVTLNNNATASITTTAVFFPWGNGNAITTFNVPDLRGVVLPGRNNMGGSNSSNLTTTYYTDPNALGGNGGAQSKTLATANLPAYTPAGTNAAISVTSTSTQVLQSAGPPDNFTSVAGATTFDNQTRSAIASTGAAPAFTGTAQGGTDTPFSLIPPSKTINYAIKISPNINITVARCANLIDAGTACTANTGTSGHTLPFLDGNNTFSGTNTFTSGITISSLGGALVGRSAATAGVDVDFTIQGLVLKGTPDAALDFLIMWDNVSGSLKKVTPGQIASAATSGVSSLGGLTGALSLGSGLIASGGNTIGTTFTQTGTGAAANNLVDKAKQYMPTPQDFDLLCGTAGHSCITGFNKWLTYISTNSLCGYLPSGQYDLNAKPTIINLGNWCIEGAGYYESIINYTGASTTTNIFEIGAGTGIITGISLTKFRIASSTTMTGGSALIVNNVSFSIFDLILDGSAGGAGNGNLWIGYSFVGSQWNYINGNVGCRSICMLSYGGGSPYVASLENRFNGIIGPAAGSITAIGIRFGGGAGGYVGTEYLSGAGFAQGLEYNNNNNAHANSQLFIQETVLDFSINSNYVFNDPLTSTQNIVFGGWAGSAAANGIEILSCPNCIFQFNGASIVSNTATGIYIGDNTVSVLIDTATDISANLTAIFCNVPITKLYADNQLIGNGSDYGGTCGNSILRNQWTNFTPTLTCQGGALTSASASGRYRTIGKTTDITITGFITTLGSCGGALRATLPVTANSAATLNGRESALTGKSLAGQIAVASTFVSITTYDGSVAAANGWSINVSGVYENQ